MIQFTDNLTTVDVSKITTDEVIDSIPLRVQAGQVSENSFFRVAVDSDPYSDDPYMSAVDVMAWTNDPAISLSTDSVRGFSAAVQQKIEPGQIGSTIFVKVSADLDAIEGDRVSKIFVNDAALTVNYFVASADKGDTANSPMDRLAGDDTYSILEQFHEQGEALEIIRYDPLPKPSRLRPGDKITWQDLKNQNVVEWANPFNSQVGYKQTTYYAKGFIGDFEFLQNIDYLSTPPVTLTYADGDQLLLPADFSGFDPTPYHVKQPVSVNLAPGQQGNQRTQWTVRLNNGEYSLINIRKQKYYRGQIMFFAADLQRINYPGGDSVQGFLPWNQVYDETGKVVSYIQGWSTAVVAEPENPYLYDSSLIDDTSAVVVAPDSSALPVPQSDEAPAPEPDPTPVAELIDATLKRQDNELDLLFSADVTFVSVPTQNDLRAYDGADQWGASGLSWVVTSSQSATLPVENVDDVPHAAVLYFDNSAGYITDDATGLPVASLTDFAYEVE